MATVRSREMTTSPSRRSSARTLLAHLIEAPDLVRTLRELPPPSFSTLVRHIGVEDAGEIIALATTDQLVAAFDEDLFTNSKPGERETFQRARFVVWLEVLVEAGEEAAARRFSELSEDFAVQALSSVVLVLDNDALLSRLGEGGDDVWAAEKALESCLSEEIDGYLLVSRDHDGWDAALSLVLALDRDHRAFLVRVLDRCAELASAYVDDLEELTTVLSAAESNAEDVEAEREERRSKLGYVDPRAARGFLALARTPVAEGAAGAERDPITRAYFRDLEPSQRPARADTTSSALLVRAIDEIGATATPEALGAGGERGTSDHAPIVTAMRLLGEHEPPVFGERTEELAYLANVLLAGADSGGARMTAREAAECVLATVGLGAELEARGRLRTRRRATPDEIVQVLRDETMDLLFRKASSSLVAHEIAAGAEGFLRSRGEIDGAAEEVMRFSRRTKSPVRTQPRRSRSR